MAVSFFKWLIILTTPLLFSFTKDVAHPFHVSVTEIHHNAKEQALEVSCKIFTDDFEKALAQKFRARVDLGRQEMHVAMDTLVKRYLAETISIRPGGKATHYNYLGFELDQEAVYCYFEIPGVSSLQKLDVSNLILYDLFDDQMNIIHVTVNGKRKSDKLSYPARELSFTF